MFRVTIFFCMTSAAYADTYVADAFGILPKAAVTEDRAAWAGLQTGASSNVAQAEDPDAILLFIGAKSWVAGKDEGHAVAITLDRHGNLVQDKSVTFALGTNDELSAQTSEGLADVLFLPAPVAGTFSGGATVGALQSARALYRVVADLESVQPTIKAQEPLQTESFQTVSSQALQDQYGNPIEDGVGATLLVTHDDGATTQLSAPVREMRAEATVLVRDIATGGSLTTVLGNNTGTGSVKLDPLQSFAPVEVRLWPVEDLNAVAIRIGPVMTDAGHLLNDGAPVSIKVVAADQTATQNGWLLDGYFETTLPLSQDATTFDVTLSTALGEDTAKVALSEAPNEIRGAE